MSDIESRLDRIEQLLLEGNRLRQQAIDLQTKMLERQASDKEEYRSVLVQTKQVNEGALSLQAWGRKLIPVAGVLLLLLLAQLAQQIFQYFFNP